LPWEKTCKTAGHIANRTDSNIPVAGRYRNPYQTAFFNRVGLRYPAGAGQDYLVASNVCVKRGNRRRRADGVDTACTIAKYERYRSFPALLGAKAGNQRHHTNRRKNRIQFFHLSCLQNISAQMQADNHQK
jgi:hypothetical protein